MRLIWFLPLAVLAVQAKDKTKQWWRASHRGLGFELDSGLVQFIHGMLRPPTWAHPAFFTHELQASEMCSMLRGLEWLITESIDDVDRMSHDNETLIEEQPHLQKGPIVLTIKKRILRTMMIWTKLLDVLDVQLWLTPSIPAPAQRHLAQCYTDYAFKTTTWLEALRQQAPFFNPDSKARRMIYSRLHYLYRAYANIMMRIYFGRSATTPIYKAKTLTTHKWGDEMPPNWNPNIPHPQPSSPIRSYFMTLEPIWRNKHVSFEETIREWTCAGAKDVEGVFSPGRDADEAARVTGFDELRLAGDVPRRNKFFDGAEDKIFQKYRQDLDKFEELSKASGSNTLES